MMEVNHQEPKPDDTPDVALGVNSTEPLGMAFSLPSSTNNIGIRPLQSADTDSDSSYFTVCSPITNQEDHQTRNVQLEKVTVRPAKRAAESSGPPSDPDENEPDLLPEGQPKLKRRKNFCPFCEKLISNFSRHLVSCHGDKPEIKEYKNLANESPKRRKLNRAVITNNLRKLGNHMHNKQIVEGKIDSDFLPVKRSSHQKHNVNNSTHVVCKHCLGFFKKESLYKHISNCNQRPSSVGTDQIQEKKKNLVLSKNSFLMIKESNSASALLKTEVFPKMQRDAETVIVQGDDIITKYGSVLRFTHRTARQVHYCTSRMRTLARLFLTMKRELPEIKEFRDCIKPSNFPILVDSVRVMSKFDSETGMMKIPSIPPRLCSSLKRCANIIKSDAIKDESLSREQRTEIMYQMNNFLFLMNTEWATEVGSNSERSRKNVKAAKNDLLPDPEDIVKISSYLHGLCPLYIAQLKQIPTVHNYEKLAKIIIASIITLSRRRPNETVEITLDAYMKTLDKQTHYGQESQNVISKEEINCGDQLSIFYLSANKNQKKVPALLTKQFNEAIDVLIESREKIGITSKYLFGRPGETELFDGTAVMREIVKKCNLNSPSTFTANSLRHHAATSSQLHKRNDTFTKRLSQFMGHDLKTHEKYYEMPLPMVQKYLVGPRLLAMTKPGPSETVTSMSNQDHSLDSEQNSPSTSTSRNFILPMNEDTISSTESTQLNQCDSLNNNHPCSSSPTQSSSFCLEGKSRQFNSELQKTPPHTDSEDDSTPSMQSTPKKVFKKVRWTESEKKTVYEKFAHHFILHSRPTRKEIKQVWESENSLKNRTLQQIVTYINNIVLQKQKIPTPVRKKMKAMVSKGSDTFSS